jgi:hypothetical protein
MLWVFDWVRGEPRIIILIGIRSHGNILDSHAFSYFTFTQFHSFRHSYKVKKMHYVKFIPVCP